MKRVVLHLAPTRCTHGSAPAQLLVAPSRPALVDGAPMATVRDHLALTNLTPFALCRSPANPAVASATAAAGGVLTPQPCVPSTPSPWTQPGGAPSLDGVDALTDDATCACAWGGTVSLVAQPRGPSLDG